MILDVGGWWKLVLSSLAPLGPGLLGHVVAPGF